MKWLLVFTAMLAADYLWTRWMMAVADKRAFAAANFSALIIAVGAVTTLAYVDDPAYLLPACLGAWVGTWVSVRG